MKIIVDLSLLTSYNNDSTFINVRLEFNELVYGVLLVNIIYMTPIDFSKDNSKSNILINSTKLSKLNHLVVSDPSNNSLLLIENNLLKGNTDYITSIQIKYINTDGNEVNSSLLNLFKYLMNKDVVINRVTAKLDR